MKKYLVLIFSLFYVYSFSQKTVEATVIKVDKDTLKVNAKITTNMFDPALIQGSSFNKKLTIVNKEGPNTKMETSDVEKLTFKDFTGKERVFINNSEDRKSLSEVLFDGKNIQMFRAYQSGGMRGGESATDFIFNKTAKKGIGLSYFTGLPKKKLKEFFNDEPAMIAVIEESKGSSFTDEITATMISILKKYEDLKSKNKLNN